ncbi:MAG: glycosyltransferase family 4 protein [Anaerolineales bacterium]|nr:glycosyltransferase family 4 protein [Anaerolineales bacterium]
MKILVINYEFPPVGGGGGQASADICEGLVARGHEVRVLTSRAPDLPGEEVRSGVRIHRILTGRKSRYRASFPVMLAFLLLAFFPGLRLIRSWKPDVIHVHFAVPTGALVWLLSLLTGVPYILTAHLGDVPGGVPQKTGRWFRMVYPFTPPIWKGAAAIAAVSEFTRDLALEHYPVRIDVIPNGVHLPEQDPANLKVSDPPELVFAGRFQPQKNVPFLIEAAAAAADLPWNLTLLGDGPQRVEIEALVKTHQLEDRIFMRGWVSPDEVWQIFLKSDLLVMPSLSEGLPVVGVQALACGLAIAGTTAGGLSELITDRLNGRLVEVGDDEAYVAALRWCVKDSDRLLKMKRESLKIAQRYDIKAVAEAYEAILRRALNK